MPGEKKKYTIEDMRNLAKSKNGLCLSENYITRKTKLTWKCEQNHIWDSSPGKMLDRNVWCPICGKEKSIENRRLGINKVIEIGNDLNLKLLSKKYINASQKLEWECDKGHLFLSTITAIKGNQEPCPQCKKQNFISPKKKGSEYFTNYANKNNGLFLRELDNERLVFQCEKGHEWETSRNSILSGSWCVKCSYIERGNRRRTDLEICSQLAKERGGELLSKEYDDNIKKLTWECKHGHIWKTEPSIVLGGSWCPECSSGLGERICRVFFNEIFNDNFIREYPDWLINNRNNKMELDGYSEKLNIAFEHQGEQHFSLTTMYIKNEKKLMERQQDDKRKAELCKENGVSLFIIPSILQHIPINEVKTIIKKEAHRLNVTLPKNYDDIIINHNKAYEIDSHVEKLEELKRVCEEHEGYCLSDRFILDKVKLKFKCKENHIWEAIPKDILKGHWCPKCAQILRGKQRRFTISQLNKIIDTKGVCLSQEYIHYETPLDWQCNNNHKFSTSVRNIMRGGWCPVCYKENLQNLSKEKLEGFKQLASDKGGVLLSKKYENEKRELKWKCKIGHIWFAPPSRLKNSDAWCPDCAKNKPFTISYINQFVSKYGGKCLSSEYKNYRSVLTFECIHGHTWENKFINIKRGSWCPICKKLEL